MIFHIPPENDRIDNIQTGVLVDLLKNMVFTFHQKHEIILLHFQWHQAVHSSLSVNVVNGWSIDWNIGLIISGWSVKYSSHNYSTCPATIMLGINRKHSHIVTVPPVVRIKHNHQMEVSGDFPPPLHTGPLCPLMMPRIKLETFIASVLRSQAAARQSKVINLTKW